MMRDTPLTILDPNGEITPEEVQNFLSTLEVCHPLRVTGQRRVNGESVVLVDHDLDDVDYHDRSLNEAMVHIGHHFITRGCEFTSQLDVRASQAAKIRGR